MLSSTGASYEHEDADDQGMMLIPVYLKNVMRLREPCSIYITYNCSYNSMGVYR